jgi:hypothetical protein
VVLLANSVANYQFVSRKVVVDQLRRDMGAQVAALDREISRRGLRTAADIAKLLEALGGDVAWVSLRDSDGNIVARAGMRMDPVFTHDQVRERSRERQPSFRTMDTPRGPAVVEAFAMRLPATAASFRTVSDGAPPKPPRPALLEMGALIDGAAESLWPLRRNLLINCSAAIVLLGSIALVGLRFRAYLKGRQLEEQVELARHVQRDLLPQGDQSPTGFRAAADFLAAGAVGGDFYDAFEPAPGQAAFVVGDVAGKGVPAALLTGVIHGAVRSSCWTGSARAHEDATARLNRLLCKRAAPGRFASLFWSHFDPDSGLLLYINAGHLPPLLFRADGGEPIRLDEGGPVLGVLGRASFHQGAVKLEPGDVVVMYSDGLAEWANSRDEHFGEAGISAAVRDSLECPVEEIRDRIVAAAARFAGASVPEDDRTLLVVRYQGVRVGERHPQAERCSV